MGEPGQEQGPPLLRFAAHRQEAHARWRCGGSHGRGHAQVRAAAVLRDAASAVTAVRERLRELTEADGVDLIAAATSMAGTFWNIATPGPGVAALYRSDPRLVHAIVESRLARILSTMLEGITARRRGEAPMTYLPHDTAPDTVYVFATQGGAPTHPDRYRKLTAAGAGTIERGTATCQVTVRELIGAERDRIHAEQARRYPGFAEYERQTAGIRIIPVLELRRA
ncbi:nitroreductase family deazaflavin-dependent oxidoreductase [Streptomyces sp. NPDC001581]|uniref:nitroreductase family deazaflavin-dependent oxidoreductase n=1 Tax=Streptomyces sp. NPDC001581 TaxID=3154386 RepID=UPI00332FBF3B